MAAKASRQDIADSAKKKGDEVFQKEDQLYTSLRAQLDA
jgi:hypothetical protein